ncbi:dnaJ homolog subfamily C member 10-like [Ptychodera flava]|uniref:dnaJ homolog subfamily C member 10-like n=1 Tax=Ptychodera flava TaxID=63121 RepID=UPI003969C57C
MSSKVRLFHIKLWTCLVIFSMLFSLVITDDYYEILGVERDASTKDIRRAFKKLALKMHPDKNPDDPKAHDKFLKVNRAYEVLKDEELRKKFDRYGEDGLKDQGQWGQRYESWNFYKTEFGLYDEDPEVVTLSKSDFEHSVFGADIWFVNFYSPRCHHCHDLAPTWRKFAKEMEGVIRIGAVNCWDDNPLCTQQGIMQYPTLVVYPKKEFYTGAKTLTALVRHALRQVKATIHDLWAGNFKKILTSDEIKSTPLLMMYCGSVQGSREEETAELVYAECLNKDDRLKVAAILDKIVTVAHIDCSASGNLCERLGISGNTLKFYEKAVKVKKGAGTPVEFGEPKEIAGEVLKMLPDIQTIDEEQFKKMRDELSNSSKNMNPVLIHFVKSNDDAEMELRKLLWILDDITVKRVDCSTHQKLCQSLYVNKNLPAVALFRKDGEHEMHHGRMMAQDIAAFARESVTSPVHMLDPSDFPDPVINSGEPWFVDFFSPHCPPCKQLIPEWRKAARQLAGQIKFGTVDCTVHNALCNQNNIRSYPTTVFYNETTPHTFTGVNTAQGLIDFVEDIMHPLVVELTPNTFDSLVKTKSKKEMWLVDFYAPWCGPCQALAPEWRKLAKKLNGTAQLGTVDCVKWSGLCSQNGVASYPTIRMYPQGKSGLAGSMQYTGWMRDANSLQGWVYSYLPSVATTLDMHNFASKLLQDTEPWLVYFYAGPWCGPCTQFMPQFENAVRALEDRVHAGKINCDHNQGTCMSSAVNAYPSIRLYYGAKRKGASQGWTGEYISHMQGVDYIINYVKGKIPADKLKKKRPKDEL